MCISANWWEEILRKKENTKVTGTGLLNAHKDTRKSWDIEWPLWFRGCAEGCPVTQKRRENYLSFWAQKVENSECPIWDFLKNSRHKESSVARRVGQLETIQKDLESLGWVEHNQKKIRPKSSKIDRLPQTTTFQTLLFHEALSKLKILRNPEPIFWFISA